MAILHFGSEEEAKKAFDKSRSLKINNRPVAVYYARIRANAANDKKDKTAATPATDKAKQAQSAQKEKPQAQSKQVSSLLMSHTPLPIHTAAWCSGCELVPTSCDDKLRTPLEEENSTERTILALLSSFAMQFNCICLEKNYAAGQ